MTEAVCSRWPLLINYNEKQKTHSHSYFSVVMFCRLVRAKYPEILCLQKCGKRHVVFHQAYETVSIMQERLLF